MKMSKYKNILYSTGKVSTCKLSVRCTPAPKLSDQLPIGLKDEHAAGLVVYSDYMSILVHSHTLRTHQPTCTNFVLRKTN